MCLFAALPLFLWAQIALQTLLKFVTNVMGAPMEEKFRSIRLNNAVFQTRLGQK